MAPEDPKTVGPESRFWIARTKFTSSRWDSFAYSTSQSSRYQPRERDGCD